MTESLLDFTFSLRCHLQGVFDDGLLKSLKSRDFERVHFWLGNFKIIRNGRQMGVGG